MPDAQRAGEGDVGVEQGLFQRCALAADQPVDGLAEEQEDDGEEQRERGRDHGGVQYQRIGTCVITGTDGAADGRGNAPAHGACREHLLQHQQGKHQCDAGQLNRAQAPDVSGLGNAHQRGGDHGKHVGQAQAPEGGKNGR